MPNSQQFVMAADVVKKLKTRPSDDDMLFIYSHFKQATVGDNNNPEPGFLNFKEKSKHAAWMKLKGMDQYDAEVAYINKVNQLISFHGIEEQL